MSARVRLEVARAENVLSAHEAALRFTLDGADPGEPRSRVWLRTGPAEVQPIAVRAGISDGVYTELAALDGRSLAEGAHLAIGLLHPETGARKPQMKLGSKP
jgi:hypothetical protein